MTQQTARPQPSAGTVATIRRNRHVAEDHRNRLLSCSTGNIVNRLGTTTDNDKAYFCSEIFKPSDKIDPLYPFKFHMAAYDSLGDYYNPPVENESAQYAPQLHEQTLEAAMDPYTQETLNRGEKVFASVQIGPNRSVILDLPITPGYVTYAGYLAGDAADDLEINPQTGERGDITEHPQFDTGFFNRFRQDSELFNAVLMACLTGKIPGGKIEHCLTAGVVLKREHIELTQLNQDLLEGLGIEPSTHAEAPATAPDSPITLADIQRALGGSVTGGDAPDAPAPDSAAPLPGRATARAGGNALERAS